MTITDSPIIKVILRYHPEWEPPDDNGYEWVQCLCPFHGDTTASAAVSFDLQAFNCLACGVKGDAIAIIKSVEEVNYPTAKRIAEEVSVGCDVPVQSKPTGKSSRRVFGESGPAFGVTVRPGIRGRPTPWT